MELDSSSRSGVSGVYPNLSYSYSLELEQQDDLMETSDFDVDIFGTKLHVPWSKVEAAQQNFQDQVGMTACQNSMQGEFDVATCGSQMHSTLQAPLVSMKDKFRSETVEDGATSDPTSKAACSPAKEDKDLSEDDDSEEQEEDEAGGPCATVARTFRQVNRKTRKALRKTWAGLERDAEMCNMHDMLEFQEEMKEEMKLKAEDFLRIIREDDASLERMIPHQDTATSWGLATLQEPSKNGGFLENLFGQGGEKEQKTVIIELPDDFGIEDSKERKKKKPTYHKVKVYKTPDIETDRGDPDEAGARETSEAGAAEAGEHTEDKPRANRNLKETRGKARRVAEKDVDSRVLLKKATSTKHRGHTNEAKKKVKATGKNEDLSMRRKAMEGKTGKSDRSEPEGFRVTGDDEVSVEKGNSDALQGRARSIYDLASAEDLDHQSSSVWRKLKKLTKKKKQIASSMFAEVLDETERKVVEHAVAQGEGKALNEMQGSEENPIVLEDFEEPNGEGKEDKQKATTKQTVDGESQEHLTLLIREYLKWNSDSVADEQTRNQTKEQLMKTLQEHMKAQKHQSAHSHESREGLEEEKITRESSDKRESVGSTEKNSKSRLLADPNKNGQVNMYQRPLTPEKQREEEYLKKTHQGLEEQRDDHLWLLKDSRYSAVEDTLPPRPPSKSRVSSLPTEHKDEDATVPSSDPKHKLPFNDYKHVTLDSKEKTGSSLKEELANLRQQQAALFAEGRETFRRHTRTRRVKPSPERVVGA